MFDNFEVYYKNVFNEYEIYNYELKEYRTENRKPSKINNYYLFNDYKLNAKESKNMTNEEIKMHLQLQLAKFSDDLLIWSNELVNTKSLLKSFNFLEKGYYKSGVRFYHNSYSHIFNFYKNYGGRYKLFKDINNCQITKTEYKWFESTNNGGIVYLRQKDEIYNCYGYDFSLNYPNLLSSRDFYFPICEGREIILDKLPEKLTYGIYKIKFDISTITDNFKMLVKIVDSNCYTHFDINFIKSTFPYVKFELINDGLPNCIIYDKLISGSELFYPWLCRIRELREEFPKNKLVKHLASKLWGCLIEGEVKYYKEHELEENNIDFTKTHCLIDMIVKKNGSFIYKVSKNMDGAFYKYNIRIKSFLTSYARINCSKLALENINNVVRIQTDSVVFSEPLTKKQLDKFKNLKPEDKTTGEIYFEHVNLYNKI